MKKSLLLIVSILILSCSNDKNGVQVIDKIKLGVTKTEFIKQCDSLKIPILKFYTKTKFLKNDNTKNSILRLRYTKMFDMDAFKVDNSQHLGLFMAETNSRGTRVTGLNVLFGYTIGAFRLNNFEDITEKTKIKSFEQDMRVDLIQEIEEILIEKYGVPKSIISKETRICAIEGLKVNNLIFGPKNPMEVLSWKTDYYDVSLYKGIPSNNSKFDLKKGYITVIHNQGIEQDMEDIATNRFAYLNYNLNEKGLKLLKDVEFNL